MNFNKISFMKKIQQGKKKIIISKLDTKKIDNFQNKNLTWMIWIVWHESIEYNNHEREF